MKTCNTCKEDKEEVDFYKYRKMCKKCHHKRCVPYTVKWQKKNPEKCRELAKARWLKKRQKADEEG